MNAARGEVSLSIGGEARVLCLTLGALAEIEAGLGADGAEALAARLRRLSAGDLTLVLAALLRGGGEAGADGLALRAEALAAAEAVAAAFESS